MRTVTFPTLHGYWSPITAASRLKAGKSLGLVLDGVPVVAFRDEKGQTRALVDRCPHRIVVARRNFGKFSVLPRIYDLLTPVILAEDRRNKIMCWPSEVPAGGEVSMPSDAPSIAFQRWYRGWVSERISNK